MSVVEAHAGLAEEDRLRARLYAFLSHLLSAAPDAETLGVLCRLDGDDTAIGAAIAGLRAAASTVTPEQARNEFDVLFIGLTGGEAVPYACHYLTGFLYDRPLVRLRDDLAALGIRLADDVAEPEDHIASLLEVMHGLIVGSFGAPAGLDEQKRFFEAHLDTWAARFFTDLESAGSARLYRGVARLGRQFLVVEAEAFGMT